MPYISIYCKYLENPKQIELKCLKNEKNSTKESWGSIYVVKGLNSRFKDFLFRILL